MMLSASPFYNPVPYIPTRSSPLSERSANVLPRPFSFTMASQPQFDKKTVPQRTHKPNPAIQSRDAATQRRRHMFIRRVQQDREDRNWEARGERIQQLDFISDQKRWEAEKARQAPKLNDDLIDEEVSENDLASNTLSSSQQPEQEMSEADYVLAQEEYETQALIELMEAGQEQQDTASQHYGSDDEDYDQIFMECTPDYDVQQHSNDTSASYNDTDDMDMTDG